MAIRFRKSINLGGGVRINLSKSGIGASIGVKGARVTKMANGRTRKTISVPGTGISHVTESSSSKSKRTNISNVKAAAPSNTKIFSRFFIFLGVLTIAFSALLALALPVVGIVGIVFGIIELVASKKLKKKIKKYDDNTTLKKGKEGND